MRMHGIGVDVVDIDRVSRLLEQSGTTFAARWFTAVEISGCESSEHPAGAYALRLAAKEAVWKSLGISGRSPVPWRSIQVTVPGDGPVRVDLAGEVAAAAARMAVARFVVSTSLEGNLATVVAIAESAEVGSPGHRPPHA